jgi:hypothetical protein
MKSMPMTLALLLLTGSTALSQNTPPNFMPGAPSVGVPRGVNPSNSQDLTNRSNSQDLTVPGASNSQDLSNRRPTAPNAVAPTLLGPSVAYPQTLPPRRGFSRLHDADRRQLPKGRSRDARVPVQGAPAHIAVSDLATSPERLHWRARPHCLARKTPCRHRR